MNSLSVHAYSPSIALLASDIIALLAFGSWSLPTSFLFSDLVDILVDCPLGIAFLASDINVR